MNEQQKQSKSVVVKQFGGYESVLIEDYKLLSLDDNIEVQVEYGALNFADIYTRRGFMPHKKLPFVLGIECTGVVTKIGSQNNSIKVGQRVICYDYNGGLYGETIHIKPSNCFPLPESIDNKLGATIFVNYLTAYFSVLTIGNLKENESVLILSCTGGVGTAAIQLSKTVKGVKTFGTGSKIKQPHALENGVDTFYCIDTFLQDVKGQKFDLIVSNESGRMLEQLQEFLTPLGRIVLIGANNMLVPNENGDASQTDYDKVPLLSLVINNRIVAGLHLGLLLDAQPAKIKAVLDEVFELIEQGKLKPIIHSVWKMAEIVEATKLLEERKNVGKVLIKIKE
ncbi:unnamed protein product [Phyllotreta striolata]|uniref:Enoyl reductase (ER) domain-containing protein n=1 Tax=Phyllotreta striolata TaxID=444603 RepID=A0A9P0DPY7_PHYSR|nr:unnamed protein product [Phyllotreta striolata]